MKNIILIGMPGCGKSTLGKKLAARLGVKFYDADDVLEEREARTIKSFFAESEDAFRDAETRTLRYMAHSLKGVVIATGGGAVKRGINMELIGENGVIIFIERAPEKILSCIGGDARPLLAQDKQRIFNLYNERIDLYKKYGQYIIDNNQSEADALTALYEIATKVGDVE
ncbi:MAG: shikimate kinase [Phascolarctobacterium sp.]|nr:shikimate kinase [Phascolarctobacterium sp.]